MADESVPVIDIAPSRRDQAGHAGVARKIAAACETIGFFTITGHGVDGAVIEALRAASGAFFAQPAAAKAMAGPPAPSVPRGYRAIGDEGLGASDGDATPPDLKEVFHLGPIDYPADAYHLTAAARPHFIENVWPAAPAGFRPAATAYYRAMERLAGDLMALFARALDVPPADFARRIDRHISALRIISYPPLSGTPRPGQLRAGAHSDYGTLTILLSENKPGGLQVRTRSGAWIDVLTPPDAFVINIGDLMMRWTNDRWMSNQHRVVNPPPEAGDASRRLSVVFFHHPNYDAEIACIDSCAGPGTPAKYPPVLAGPYRLDKYTRTRIAEPVS
ncbi:MAG: isopenicillin N synthase family dioxygenase [Alphaproteobacteria bacterium]